MVVPPSEVDRLWELAADNAANAAGLGWRGARNELARLARVWVSHLSAGGESAAAKHESDEREHATSPSHANSNNAEQRGKLERPSRAFGPNAERHPSVVNNWDVDILYTCPTDRFRTVCFERNKLGCRQSRPNEKSVNNLGCPCNMTHTHIVPVTRLF